MRTFNRALFLTISIPLSLVFLSPIFGQPAYGNDISGELIEDTTWFGICVLEGNVIVPEGIVLNIEPGTVIRMKQAGSLIVFGRLLAVGTKNAPIHFTRYD
ncbi:MAG: hypothetical protein JXM79_03405 [Sedimentisphaerales bacterium]|nr:hypothetical protein [Sedimentisphaerales bacterium]